MDGIWYWWFMGLCSGLSLALMLVAGGFMLGWVP